MDGDLLSTLDIAQLIGVTRQRAHQLVNLDGFPPPVATVNKRTKVWDRHAVVAWAGEHRYDITPPPSR